MHFWRKTSFGAKNAFFWRKKIDVKKFWPKNIAPRKMISRTNVHVTPRS